MIQKLTGKQHTVAFLPKTEQEYNLAVQSMTEAGFEPFSLSGFDGENFVGYSPALARGKAKFTDGNAPKETVLYVDTIQDLVDTSKNEIENFDPVAAEKIESEVVRSVLARILGQ